MGPTPKISKTTSERCSHHKYKKIYNLVSSDIFSTRSHFSNLGCDFCGPNFGLGTQRVNFLRLLRVLCNWSLLFFLILIFRGLTSSQHDCPLVPRPDLLARIPVRVLTPLKLTHELSSHTEHDIHSNGLKFQCSRL